MQLLVEKKNVEVYPSLEAVDQHKKVYRCTEDVQMYPSLETADQRKKASSVQTDTKPASQVTNSTKRCDTGRKRRVKKPSAVVEQPFVLRRVNVVE